MASNSEDMMQLMDGLDEGIAVLVGYRTKLLNAHFSETATEQMVVGLQLTIFTLSVENAKLAGSS